MTSPPAVLRGVTETAVAEGGPPPDLTMNRAREALGLDFGAFELAVETGEIATVRDGTGRPRVPSAELERVRHALGGAEALLERIRLVNTTAGAELLGISRDRLLRLTRAGRVWPVRWYVNRYRAVVWLYLAGELRDFATGSPALLAGRLPAGLRAEADEGADLRPRSWRTRQVAQLVSQAPGPWEEAAIWAALLGPEVIADAVPDPYERSRLRTLHPELPHGRPGVLADASLVRRLTTADAPDEIATALLALSDALGRARAASPLALTPPAPPRGLPSLVPPRAAAAEAAAQAAGAAVPQSADAGPVPEAGAAALRVVAGGVRAQGPGGAGGRIPPGAGPGAPPGRALRSLRRLLRKGQQLSAR